MSPILIFALFILASDFLLFVLFHWTYPDRSAKAPIRPRLSTSPPDRIFTPAGTTPDRQEIQRIMVRRAPLGVLYTDT